MPAAAAPVADRAGHRAPEPARVLLGAEASRRAPAREALRPGAAAAPAVEAPVRGGAALVVPARLSASLVACPGTRTRAVRARATSNTILAVALKVRSAKPRAFSPMTAAAQGASVTPRLASVSPRPAIRRWGPPRTQGSATFQAFPSSIAATQGSSATMIPSKASAVALRTAPLSSKTRPTNAAPDPGRSWAPMRSVFPSNTVKTALLAPSLPRTSPMRGSRRRGRRTSLGRRSS